MGNCQYLQEGPTSVEAHSIEIRFGSGKCGGVVVLLSFRMNCEQHSAETDQHVIKRLFILIRYGIEFRNFIK